MSRKHTNYGQNDISIIGKLPQRLQKKIADKAGLLDGLENLGANDYIDDEISHEASSKTTVFTNPDVDDVNTKRKIGETKKSIPGVLRLNNSHSKNEIDSKPDTHLKTENRKRLSKSQYASKVVSQTQSNDDMQQKVLKPKNVQREGMLPKEISLHTSPAHGTLNRKYPSWFDSAQLDLKQCTDLKQHYDTITGVMLQNAVLQHWTYFNEKRAQMLQIFKHITLEHLKLCCEMKCDSLFWKLLFYNVRELLKHNKSACAHDSLLELFDNGIVFYKDLYKCLKTKYLDAEESTQICSENDGAQTSKSTKFEIIARVAAQKILINLGDLCRYRALQMQSNDLSQAAVYYREAQILIPTNGIPYNQLAIVAIHDRKKFEAIYLHIRSLMASNPIQSARESLLTLFDDIRKKFEKNEQKVSPVHQYKTNSSTSNANGSHKVISPMRKEVWIHPDGIRRLHRTNVDNHRKACKPAKSLQIRLDEMPADELLHKFISIYLYVIGKLYTNIGMETIQAHQSKLLTQLSAVLKRETTAMLLTRSKVLKITAMNIFILHHNLQKDARRETRYYTFTFCNQILGLFLQKCNQLFKTLIKEHETEAVEKCKSFQDLNTLLQFVKTYTDYLSLNVHIWEPIRNEEQFFVDPWIELQSLFETIDEFFVNTPGFKEEFNEHRQNKVVVEENQFFYGFTPLSAIQAKFLKAQTCSSERDQFIARTMKIKEFETLFQKHSEQLQFKDFDDADSSFVLEELNNDIKTALETLSNVAAVNENDIEMVHKCKDQKEIPNNKSSNDLNNENRVDVVANNQIAHLTKLKKELEQQTNAKRLYSDKLEKILNLVDSKVYIEVRPKYLMPDTNCFIDCLDDFKKLLTDFNRFTLVIPLTVVRELDGLSKGVKLESRPHSTQKHRIHHFDDVSTSAKRSLDFIKEAKQNVKCITTKGSIINASLFALVEEEYMSNDDRILSTALAWSKTICRETSNDDKFFIQTQLVLITTDRNLRVKALSRNLAVSELDEFLLWARDCCES